MPHTEKTTLDLASLVYVHVPLLVHLSCALRQVPGKCGPQELGTMAWSLATLAALEVDAMMFLEEETKRRLEVYQDLEPQNLKPA